MKKGFSLIIAILFLLVLVSVGMLSLRTLAQSNKETSELYLYEQAKLLAISFTEYAVKEIQNYNFDNNCLKELTLFYPYEKRENVDKWLFKTVINVKYIGANRPAGCEAKYWIDSNISTKANGSPIPDRQAVIQAVILNTKVVSNPNIGEPISVDRTTVQQP